MVTMSHEPDTRIVADGKYIQLVRQDNWEFARRKGISGIVGVVAVTDGGKLVLVEQYRSPVRASVIELPAGLAGDAKGHEGEDLADAARRELLEETGYEAKEVQRLAAGAASAGMTDEIITLFRATGLRKTGEGTGDETEDITVHEVPLADVVRWLAEQERGGKLVDLKVYCGLYFAR
jgi:ADP-ribose pyrophosphatase